MTNELDSNAASPNTEDAFSERPVARRPALVVAVTFATGIALDRWATVPWSGWLVASIVLALSWGIAFSRPRAESVSAGLLLMLSVCLGGARHHGVWSTGTADDVSLFAVATPQPVRLTGTLVTPPWIREKQNDPLRSAFPQLDRSSCIVECESLQAGSQRVAVSGRVLLSVTGHLLHVGLGDRVDISGSLAKPGPPGNPGQFSYPDYLRRQQVHAVLHAGYPDAVRKIASANGSVLGRWSGQLRDEADFVLVKNLRPENAVIASALLLGNRGQLTDDLREDFAESGMMHLLAISGLHVGILAAFVWFGCRFLNLSTGKTSLVVLTVIVGYAFITAGRPPVIRATVLIVVVFLGMPWHRQSRGENSLAVAMLIILMWNPTALFDVGAQLSFLAAASILWSQSLWRTGRNQQGGLDSLLNAVDENRFRQLMRTAADWLKRSYLMMGAIWLFTAPLVAAKFHLVSPIGFAINIFLIPFVAVTLWAGFGLLFSGLLLPSLAPLFGFVFDASLSALLWIAQSAAGTELGHRYVPGPPTWWLVGYYVVLALVVCSRPTKRPSPTSTESTPAVQNSRTTLQAVPAGPPSAGPAGRFRLAGWSILCAWTLIGLIVGLQPRSTQGLRCTFLAVGHGCAVLVEFPNGRTLLYDAGSLSDGHRARQIVQSALWARGRQQIDVIVVSHADLDHLNAVPGLLRTLPVGSLLVSQPFLDFEQQSVMEVCETAAREEVPIHLIGRGDRLLLDKTVQIRVLHPSFGGELPNDNANSIVLQIDYRGRRILLTGDLEDEGMQRLLARDPLDTDVLLSPHHGSLNANGPELADWATAEWVVVSGGRSTNLPRLRELYEPHAKVLSTGQQGAISFEISPDGTMSSRAFRSAKAQSR